MKDSHYNRLLKSREKFKQWHLQFFEALSRLVSRDESLVLRDECLVPLDKNLISRDENLVSQEGGNLLLSGAVSSASCDLD